MKKLNKNESIKKDFFSIFIRWLRLFSMSEIGRIVVFIALLITVASAHADQDQLVTDVGLGVFGSRGASLSQDKFAKIGWEEDLWYNLKQKFNVGAWIDTRGAGYSSNAFTGYQLGFEVTNSIFQMSVWSGPTLISSPDNDLGGVFQFNETIFFGIVDKDQNSIGLAYNHFSSAGLEMPNQGRDFIGLEIKFPF